MLVIGYGGVPALPALAARMGTVGVDVDVILPEASGGDAPLTYSAARLPAGLVFTPATRRVAGTPTTAEVATVTYSVEDDDGDTDSDQFDWTIVEAPPPPNQGPTANAGPDQSGIAAGATVNLDGSGSSDPDGSIDSYLWEQTAGDTVALSDAAAAQPSFEAPSTNAAQDLTFRLTVTDDGGATDTDTVTVGVLAEVVTPPPTDPSGLRFDLPEHTVPNNSRVRWEDTAAGLGNVASLSDSIIAVIIRFQIRGDQSDSDNAGRAPRRHPTGQRHFGRPGPDERLGALHRRRDRARAGSHGPGDRRSEQ